MVNISENIFTSQNTETELAKNYRPIACLNFMYKIYTSCLNSFLYDHCHYHKIITSEQAAGKKGVWGCTEQLLINKSIMSEVRNKKRNLITIWLDYKKAFDSVPHEWLIQSLHLAKLPEDLIRAIEHLTSQWSTVLHLKGEEEVIVSDIIYFMKGIFQGDSLSVLLFILSVNPLSFLLDKLQGYACGKHKNYNVMHNFFVDDLKLYASSVNTAKKQLDLVTEFSKDTGMTFGDDKCAYQQIQNGKLLKCTNNLEINQLSVKPMKEGDTYKYLGIDENIGYVGPINKDRITKEYYHRIKKIWNSELSSFNKVIAHNTFAVPVFITSVGIVDWTINEIKEIDCKTRKQLTMTVNFHPNGDVDRLYIPRSEGGRGLKSTVRMYESRIVSVVQHLELNKSHNTSLQFVVEQELNNIIRLKEKLLANYQIECEENTTPKKLSKVFIKADIESQRNRYNGKVMHGYYEKKLEQDPGIDRSLSFIWKKDRYVTSECENYLSTIQDQELPTKYLQYKRMLDKGNIPNHNNKCRLCMSSVEDIGHILAGCPQMSSRFYLPLRHDEVAKTFLYSHIKKYSPDKKITLSNESEYIYTEKHREYWWNVSLKTATKVPHNKPDLIIWNWKTKVCTIVEFSCPLDINAIKKVSEKLEVYAPLVRNLQIMYPGYKFEIAPIVVGAMGYVPKCLVTYLKWLDSKAEKSNC